MGTWWVVVSLLGATPAQQRTCQGERSDWGVAMPPAPCLVTDFEEEWGLTAAQEACALEARDAGAAAHQGWRRCVTQWPNQRSFWRAFVVTWSDADAASERVLRSAPVARGDASRSIADELLDLRTAPKATLAALLLEHDPGALSAVLTDGRLERAERFGLAMAALERKDPASGEWLTLAPALLQHPVAVGDLRLAAALWLRLPAALRAQLRRGDDGRFPLDTAQRNRLALGLALLGEKEEAAQVARLVSAAGTTRAARTEAFGDELLRWHLTGARTLDPWEAAIEASELPFPDGRSAWELWVALLPFVHPHEAVLGRRLSRLASRAQRSPDDDLGRLPPAVRTRVQEGRERALRALGQEVATPAALPASAGDDVAAPARAVFTERATPWKGPSGEASPGVSLPGGFHLVRAEKAGQRVVALALSQRLDPVGEAGQGAAWLLLSPSGVDRWTRVYLGLGDHRPFHALPRSEVPLLDEHGVVRLTVEDSPLVEASITFPPVGMEAKTRRERVVLEAPLERLAKDTDGDGLSDLVEQRLLLDPARADTDGDGVKDGDDPTPRLDDRLARAARAEMLNAFFEDFGGVPKQRALVVTPRQDPGRVTPRAPGLDDVRFFVGTPEQLAGLRPLAMTVTLSEDEYEAAQRVYGAFYPMSVEVHLNGPDHAYVTWSERWRGGSCRIDRQRDGTLKLTSLGGWIT